jgi:hypothetical protein
VTPPCASPAATAVFTTPGGASVTFSPRVDYVQAMPLHVIGGDEEVSNNSNMAAQQVATYQRENNRLKAQIDRLV